jgi:hypothetical protein
MVSADFNRDGRPDLADVLPDAEVWINGECYYVELDHETLGCAQIARQRFPKHEQCRRLVLGT